MDIMENSQDINQVPNTNVMDNQGEGPNSRIHSVEENAINTGSVRKETHRKYPHTFKLEVIMYTQEHSKRATARKYNIDERLVRRWVQQKDEIKEIVAKGGLGAKCSRVKKGGPPGAKRLRGVSSGNLVGVVTLYYCPL